MKSLTIHLDYRGVNTQQRGHGKGLLLPVKALDSEGSILAEGVVSVGFPLTLFVPDTVTCAYVRLTWPSGRTQTKRIALIDEVKADLSFNNESFSSNKWSAWAVPRLNPRTPLASVGGELNLDMKRFDKVWLRLWRRSEGVWVQEPLRPDETYRDGAAWQFDLDLDSSAWPLQLGGSQVPWRFISLPGGGPARVLLTPTDSLDPRGDPLKVIVTSFRADAESLLEFLARDSMRAADTLMESLAYVLFAQKFVDPISAVAAAYYLLRRGSWESIPRYWFENLSNNFRWLPDASLIHCVRLLREGSDASTSYERPVNLLLQSLEHGWPVYEEGISLLQEALAALRPVLRTFSNGLSDSIQAIAAAKSWAGASTSFYGRNPYEPTDLQWVGMPNAPRRRRLNPALKSSSADVETVELQAPGIIRERHSMRRAIESSGATLQKRKLVREEFLLGDIKL